MELRKSDNSFLKKEAAQHGHINNCATLMRKDFEILRIQDHFYDLFHGVEFYSHHTDELFSIKLTIEKATQGTALEYFQDEFDFIYDLCFEAAMNYKTKNIEPISYIKETTTILTQLIFAIRNCSSVYQAKLNFVQLYMESFPQLCSTQIQKVLDEVIGEDSGVSCEI